MEEIKSFNWNAGIYTSLFFVIGLIYYLYKFNNYRNNFNNNYIPRNQNDTNTNMNQNENNNSHNSNTNSNQNNRNTDNNQDPNFFNIKILVQGQRENHLIHKDTILRQFVSTNLSNHYNSNNQAVYLIFQGTRLNLTKRLSYYPQIKNDSIIHCFISVLRSSREGDDNNNFNNNINNDSFNNDNVINLHSVVFHTCFLIIGVMLLITYKRIPGLFSKNVLILLIIIYTLWLNQLSKLIAKYIIFRQVDIRF